MAGLSFDDLIPAGDQQEAPKVSFDDLVGKRKGIVGSLEAFGRSAANMAGMGFMDEIGAAVDSAGSHILPWREPKTYDEALEQGREDDRNIAANHPVADMAGTVAGAVGLGSGLMRAGLSPTARAAGSGAGLLATSGASAVEGGVLGGIQGYGQGQGVDNRIENAGLGAGTGFAIGAVLPGLVSGATNLVRRVVSPNTIPAARQDLVNTLENEGVDVTAGQATGNNTLRYAESEIGGQAARDAYERQGEQFTRAVLRRVGVNADRATPDVIDNAFHQNTNQFNAVTRANTLVPDQQLQQDFVGNWREYMQLTPASQRAPVVANTMRDINDALINGGTLDGTTYQALRSRLARGARGATDPQLSAALNGMRDALDDAMERSIQANNPAALGDFQEARNIYRNLLVVEKAATGAGENAAQGLISPSAARNATISTHGRRNYARGNGDFADLARAGEGVMKAMPQSGTAPRTAVRNMGAALPAVLGAGAGGAAGGGYGAIAGAAAGAAIPQVVGRMMMSPTGQAYLRNQIMGGTLNPQTRAMIVTAINELDANFIPQMLNEQGLQVPAAPAR